MMKTSGWERIIHAAASLVLFAGLCSQGIAQAEDLLAQARANKILRIANTQSSPPWSQLDGNNDPAGYDVEVAREVGRRIGVPNVVFVADSYKNFVEGLKSYKYDLVMNDLTPTAEREKQVDFASPYGTEDFRIFVRAENSDIKEQSDLRRKRIGVAAGSSNETWSRAHLKDSEILGYDNSGLAINDLVSGRIDAVILSHFGGVKYIIVNHMPVKEVGEPLVYNLSAPGMVKGQTALMTAVNKAIADMTADGTLNALGKKWIGPNYDMVATIAKAKTQKE